MRIVIAEDQALFREALERLLTAAGHDVVGTAGDGAGLVRRARDALPDLIVTDVRMPPAHRYEGLRAIGEIRAAAPSTGVLLLSHHLQVDYALELLSGDARGVGYLLKQRMAEVDQFLVSVETIGRGGTVIDAEVVAAMIRRLPGPLLSGLERELLVLIAEGRAEAAIAERLAISEAETASRVTAALAALATAAVGASPPNAVAFARRSRRC